MPQSATRAACPSLPAYAQALQEECPNSPWALTFSYGRALQTSTLNVSLPGSLHSPRCCEAAKGRAPCLGWRGACSFFSLPPSSSLPLLPAASLPALIHPHTLFPPAPARTLNPQTWGGKPENWDKAQAILVSLARANSEAQQGAYTGPHPVPGGKRILQALRFGGAGK